MSETTLANAKPELLTVDSLREALNQVSVFHRPLPDSKGRGWLERMMNKLGWYRSPELYVVKDSAFLPFPHLLEPKHE